MPRVRAGRGQLERMRAARECEEAGWGASYSNNNQFSGFRRFTYLFADISGANGGHIRGLKVDFSGKYLKKKFCDAATLPLPDQGRALMREAGHGLIRGNTNGFES